MIPDPLPLVTPYNYVIQLATIAILERLCSASLLLDTTPPPPPPSVLAFILSSVSKGRLQSLDWTGLEWTALRVFLKHHVPHGASVCYALDHRPSDFRQNWLVHVTPRGPRTNLRWRVMTLYPFYEKTNKLFVIKQGLEGEKYLSSED